jgi:hypothetical protein
MAAYIKGLADQLAARANEATDLEDYKSEMAELAAEMHSTNADFAGLMTTPAGGGAQVATAASGPLSGPIPVDDLPTNAQLNQTTDSPNPTTHTVTPGGPNPAINPPASNKGPDDPGVEVQGFQGVPPAPIDPDVKPGTDSPPSPSAGS